MTLLKIYSECGFSKRNRKKVLDFCRLFQLTVETSEADPELMSVIFPNDEQYDQILSNALSLLCHLNGLECKLFERDSFENTIKRLFGNNH